MEIQKTLTRKNNLEKEDQSQRYALWCHTLLQSYSNQNSMVLTIKLTHGSMGQKRQSHDVYVLVK